MSTSNHVCARGLALALLMVGCGDAHLGGLNDDDENTGGKDSKDEGTSVDDDSTSVGDDNTSATSDGGTRGPDASTPVVDDTTPEDELPFCQFASKDTVPQEDIDAHLAARKAIRDGYAKWKAADHAHYKYRRTFLTPDSSWHDIEVRDDAVVRVEDVYHLQDMAPDPTIIEGEDLLTYDFRPNPPPVILDPLFGECLERLCIDSKANHPYLAAEVDELGAIRTCSTGGEHWSLNLYVTKL
jgi:hypothetical protein